MQTPNACLRDLLHAVQWRQRSCRVTVSWSDRRADFEATWFILLRSQTLCATGGSWKVLHVEQDACLFEHGRVDVLCGVMSRATHRATFMTVCFRALVQ
jgi:hypothetical protein